MTMTIFAKLGEITAEVWIAIGVLAAFGAAMLVLAPRVKWNARMLSTAAICVAASFVLSYIRLFRMPQGGSITVMSMLPVMLFAYIYGIGPGLVAGLALGILNFVQEPVFLTPVQFALDYIVAFSLIGLAGVTRPASPAQGGDAWRLPVGVLLGGALRTLASFVSGFVFFAEYAPAGQSAVLYSLAYNGTSIGLDTAICIVGAVLLASVGLVGRLRRGMAR